MCYMQVYKDSPLEGTGLTQQGSAGVASVAFHVARSEPPVADTCRLSVVVPVYNSETTLHRCLSSVLRSTEKDIEVVCVNDGSTDNSTEILREWAGKDARVRVFEQANKGVSAARNLALQHAGGTYITFVDADDEVEADYFCQFLTAAEQHHASCVISGYSIKYTDGRLDYLTLSESVFLSPSPRVLRSLPAGVCGHLYERRVIRESGALFPEDIHYGEDTAFHYAQYGFCHTYVQITSVGYIVHSTPGSLSSSSHRYVAGMVKATAWLAKQYERQNWPQGTKECLLHYASHAWRRICSQASDVDRRQLRIELRDILQAVAPTPGHLQTLRRSEARMIKSLIKGGKGLPCFFYVKKIRKLLKLK